MAFAERRRPAPPSPIRPQTVWWVVAGLLFVISLYLIFRSATASYSVPPDATAVRQVACQSVYGWVRGQGVQLTSTQVGYLTADQKAAYYACRAAIGDRETTIKILLGATVAFAIIGYGADLREAVRRDRRSAS